MKNLITKPLFVGAALVVALLALTSVATVSANRDAWTWTDKSSVLPRRDGITLALSAERQGSWLLSDGSNLWRFDGNAISDLNREARDRQLNNTKLLASDGRQWLIWNKPLDDRRGSLWLFEGSTWIDRTNVLPSSVETLEASGHDGQWYLNVRANGTTRLVFLNGSASIPQDVTLPLEASNIGHAAFVNGRWFWIGEQAGHLMVWGLNGLNMTPVKNIPAALHLSGIRTTDSSALIATSETPGNASFADRLWSFDGSVWTDLSAQAKASGLLPADVTNMRAAFGGNAWMILSGSNAYRYDGYALVSKGQTKDAFVTLTGGNGFVLTARGADGSAKLTVVSDDKADPEQPVTPVVSKPARPLVKEGPGGIFASRLTVTPDATDVRRGTTITVRAYAQNNTVGLNRIEISYGGRIRRLCTYGIAMSETMCDLTIDTASVAENTSFSFVARAIDAEGRETWSNGKTVLVRGANWSATVAAAPANVGGPAQWSWMEPATGELEGPQETTYFVGAWSPNGIAKIEMIANGATRKTCGYASGSTSRDCNYVVRTGDWSHGQNVAVNARVTDNLGRVTWSDAKSVLISRAWWEPMNRPGAYVTLAANKSDGYNAGDKLSFIFSGWSPNGYDHLELWMNGVRAVSIPSDIGIWTSAPLTADRVEFQARLVDRQGRETWTALYGLNKK